NQIIPAAQQDDLPSLIYTRRPALRDNGPPVSTNQPNDGKAPYGVDPRGLYPGHGAPYSQYPMAPATPAPSTDLPRVTVNPGPQMGSPGNGRISDRSNDINFRPASDNSGIAWGKWADVGAQAGGAWYVRTHKLDELKEGIDKLTPKTEKKL